MSLDYAVHSDFLSHWTGKDLDCSYDPHWDARAKSTTDSVLAKKYIERLHAILKYGLWLTEEPEITWTIDGVQVTIPGTPKVCFTELKLSESRNHARQYGRLGIGVKRPYLFTRCGRPLAYFGFHADAKYDQFLKSCATELSNPALLNFFKPMNSTRTLNYDLYSESEWRIIFLQELLDRNLLVDPRNEINIEVNAFFRSLTAIEQDQLKYLVPLDGWFAMVIYPFLLAKNMAQQVDAFQIKQEIHRIKSKRNDHGNQVEHGNWPIEVDLDACQHF
jgi:hypothetical protein